MTKEDKYTFSTMYSQFVSSASSIDGFIVGQKEDVPYDITELANEYCDARKRKDEIAKSQYLSALMVRYWHVVPYLYQKSSNSKNVSIYDVISWVYDGIEKACHYQSWEDDSKPVSKDKRGAEKCINQAISSARARFYQFSNFKKNEMMQGLSILNDAVDESRTLEDTIGETEDFVGDVSCSDIVEKLLIKREYLEAIIVDSILNYDVFNQRKDKSGTIVLHDEDGNEVDTGMYRSYWTFSKQQLIDHVENLDDSFIARFAYKYGCSYEDVKNVVNGLACMNHRKLCATINDGMRSLRQSEELSSYVA